MMDLSVLYRLFITILKMSLTASIVIVFVILVRMVLKKAPKVFSYALWIVVLFRLLCPFAPESFLSLIPSAWVVSVEDEGNNAAQVVQIETGLSMVDNQVNDFFAQHPYHGNPAWVEEAPLMEPSPLQAEDDLGGYIIPSVIWLAGMAVLLIYSVLSMLRLRKQLIEAIPLEGETHVWIADHISSAFVIGMFQPRIYLPSDLPDSERDYVLLHERSHIHRFDYIFQALAWLAVSIHWFNPLVWLAFRLAGKDMEMSCDEAVLRRMGQDIRADYSSSLLRLSAGARLPAGPLAFGDGDLTDRIKHVLDYKKPALWGIAVALVVVLVAGITLSTSRSVPDVIDLNGIRRAQSNNDILPQSPPSMLTFPETYVETFTSNGRTLDINAKVNVSEVDFNRIYTYQMTQNEIPDELSNRIIKAYFGYERTPDDVGVDDIMQFGDFTDPENYFYLYSTIQEVFLLDNQRHQFYPFEDAVYLDVNDVQCSITPQDAILMCDSFIEEIGFDDYSLDYIQGFGRGNNTQHYKVVYTRRLDDIPYITRAEYTQVEFRVDDEGIGWVKGGLFDVSEKAKVKSMLSLEDAVEKLKDTFAQTDILVFGGSYLSQFSDEETWYLHTYPIREITLEYGLSYHGVGVAINPIWRFLFDDGNGNGDRSIIYGINAITGDVYLGYY